MSCSHELPTEPEPVKQRAESRLMQRAESLCSGDREQVLLQRCGGELLESLGELGADRVESEDRRDLVQLVSGG